ncbi:TetR/AcrR family transcriptional regulator C-terminal domain-containing protein [Actinomycetospora endophytica]|uniref:TetR/AcrR family transcriptional regulator C-terminal domain-containing protein n=1 Tax=Actinomycetospora endophytica TaxID=2291215 RepID=A0ABS8PE86_9PSEU|nr:TetR/AcrR family transcriptional regulator C-terminal domain-containing protein [Actinomycetospora endophytica]MCD2195800.1 TetR/AcrR family transcriptional regulator C-terminal domain-containing protein [Actinomycetospora endophytica]
MSQQARRSPRRTEALSRERIVEAAVGMLDAAGEGGLTFRALTERLATGPGAIYWHVANKGELLAAATDAVVAAALAAEPEGASPRDRIRALALGLFDAVDAHNWVAAQLSASSWQVTTPRIFEGVGRHVSAMGVPREQWFTVTSVVVQYILGAAAQNAANAQVLGPGADRGEFLAKVSTAWEELDPDDYSFTRTVAQQMREHDDRQQFLDGIDLVLAGITAVHPPAG